MYIFKKLSLLIPVLFLVLSCGKPLPTLEGIDLVAWKEDRNACNGARTSMIEAMTAEKDKLKKLSESELVELLGRPDQNQLLSRNQKLYFYFLEPGVRCDRATASPRKLILRINAMGLARETQVSR